MNKKWPRDDGGRTDGYVDASDARRFGQRSDLLTLCSAALEAGAAALPEAARLEPMPPSVLVCAICNRGGP